MEVLINGLPYSIENNSSVNTLIEKLELSGKYAIEINQHIIPKSQYNKKITGGDKVEIVQAIGGG